MDTNIDFSNEDWGKSVKFSDGCWVIAEKHNPSLNKTMEFNNRTFVFKLINKEGKDTLLVFGCSGKPSIEAVKLLEKETGLEVTWIVSFGGAHHLFLDLWYEAFPKARIPIPAKKIPFTRNGRNLQEK